MEEFVENLIGDESIIKWITIGIGIIAATIVLFVVWLFNHLAGNVKTTKQKVWLIEKCLIGTTITLFGLLSFIEIYKVLVSERDSRLNMTDVTGAIKLLIYCVIVSAAILVFEDTAHRLLVLRKKGKK